MKLVIVGALFLLNFEVALSDDNPCPNLFAYMVDNSGTMYGIVNAPIPDNFQGYIKLDVELSIANKINEFQGKLQLFTPTSEVLQTIQQNRPLLFKLDFPFWINFRPKVTMVKVNGNLLCSGSPYTESVAVARTIVNLHSTLTINNPRPGNPYRPPQNTIPASGFEKPLQPVAPVFRPTVMQQLIPTDLHQFIDDDRKNQLTFVVPQTPSNNNHNYPPPQASNPPRQHNHNPNPEFIPTNTNNLFTTASTHAVVTQRNPTTISPPPRNTVSQYCGLISTTVPLIVDGEPSPPGANPWLAALFKQEEGRPRYICGSSLITNKHLITAAHCVKGVKAKRFHVVLGRQNINDWFSEGMHSSIEEFYTHPDYKSDQSIAADADIAILTMTQEIKFTLNIRPICLWNDDRDLENTVGTIGVVAGWGVDKFGNTTSTPSQVMSPIVSREECIRSNGNFYYATSDRTFCAGFRNNSGPCSGDSGGGFYVQRNNMWYIRGVVSHSLAINKMCDLSNYVIFADVAKYSQWIDSKIT